MPSAYRDLQFASELITLQNLLTSFEMVEVLRELPASPEFQKRWLCSPFFRASNDSLVRRWLTFPEVVKQRAERARRRHEEEMQRTDWYIGATGKAWASSRETSAVSLERMSWYLESILKGELTRDEAIKAEELATKLEAAA